MNKLLAIVLLGWLAADVSAGMEHEELGDVYFGGLEAYLVKKLPGDDDMAANLAHVKENINSLEGTTKKAGEALLELSNTGDQCDNNVMNHLFELISGELQTDGLTRINKILKDFQHRALKACETHVKQSYKDADLMQGLFISTIHPEVMLNLVKGRKGLDARGVALLVKRMANGDAGAHFQSPKYNEDWPKSVDSYAKFNRVANKYLVRPCKRVISSNYLLDNVLASRLYAIKRDQNMDPFKRGTGFGRPVPIKSITNELEELNRKRQVCERILSEDLSELARSFRFTA